jgi:hypothetical protein
LKTIREHKEKWEKGGSRFGSIWSIALETKAIAFMNTI